MEMLSAFSAALCCVIKKRTSLTIITVPFSDRYGKGQALLMVVVAMVIILSVSLSVATRSFINVRTTSEEASSSAAFSAAEAGIEKYVGNPTPYVGPIGTSDVVVDRQVVGGSGVKQLLLNNGNPILKDDGVDVWLSTYPNFTSPYWSGTLRFYWGEVAGDCSTAALEVVVISKPLGSSLTSATISRRVYDPCVARRGVNNFSTPSTPGTILGISFANHTINLIDPATSEGVLVRVIPLYANAVIAVTGDTDDFPQQGSILRSTGSSGGTQRKIIVYQGYPKVPNEFFSYTIFSP